jgi:hypothetical protein
VPYVRRSGDAVLTNLFASSGPSQVANSFHSVVIGRQAGGELQQEGGGGAVERRRWPCGGRDGHGTAMRLCGTQELAGITKRQLNSHCARLAQQGPNRPRPLTTPSAVRLLRASAAVESSQPSRPHARSTQHAARTQRVPTAHAIRSLVPPSAG